MATVAVDANGADLGPREVAEGAMLAAREGVRVLLFGPADRIGEVTDGVTVVDAPVSIAKSPEPASAARSTPDASIVRAARAVADCDADALVSAGSTGAALAAGLFNIKRAKGVHRPALALALPMPEHPVTLLDVGANADVRPDHLVQFAFMGAALVTMRQGIARPRVALLSNGEEPSRGNELVLETHRLLAERAANSFALEFVGNVEGTQLALGAADVIVADGFTGNVALKLIEGISQRLMTVIRDRASSSTRGRIGGILLRPSLRGLRDELDPEGPGGAYLLGLRKLGVVPHGRFTRVGFANAIRAAAQGIDEDVVGRTLAAMDAAGALRRPPSDSVATVADR
ncbi:MAG TPA: phosphate acyltransferase PlsX [Capillimicrobium sp.]|nr:phosphate acyltransferase PlsX [Capillimicrobium sp.]